MQIGFSKKISENLLEDFLSIILEEIIINKDQEDNFQKALGNENDLGIKVKYVIQEKPRGLPEAFTIAKKLIKNQSIAMILGDNFFFGSMLSPLIKKSFRLKNGCNIYLYPSNKTSSYGVVEFNKKNKIKKIIEKPKKTNSNSIITGLYVFDKKVVELTNQLKPSKRKELEITELLKIYQKKNMLKAQILKKGIVQYLCISIKYYIQLVSNLT